MKRGIIYKGLLAAAIIAVFSSCSVKEDRMECPCYVSVQTQTATDCIVTFFGIDGTILDRKTIGASELCSGENYTKIRKGEFYVSVLQNYDGMYLVGSRTVQCLDGEEASPIYSCVVRDKALLDDMLVKGTLQKQHAVVTLKFKCEGETYPYDIKVQSEYNGMDLISLQGSKGDFVLEPAIDQTLKAKFIMTRQDAEKPIYLYLLDKSDKSVVSKLDLNNYIRLAGYNWDAEYLGDITVTIDYAKLTLTIEVEDWDEVIIFRIQI